MTFVKDVETLGVDFEMAHRATAKISRRHPASRKTKNWKPAWSASDVAGYRISIDDFKKRWEAINAGPVTSPNFDTESWVDYQLIGSAIHRVYWELDYLKIWQEQPRFYIDQTIGVLFDLLLPPKLDSDVIEEVVNVFNFTRQILDDGISNLQGNAIAPFAQVAIDLLANIEAQIATLVTELKVIAKEEFGDALDSAGKSATDAFIYYRTWLQSNIESMQPIKAIGAEKYQWFFENVALVPFSTHELRLIGQIEWDRAVTLEHVTKNKHRNISIPPIPKTADEQISQEALKESQVRDFYSGEGILSQPTSLKHYLNAPLPPYLAPIKWLGVTDDLTSPSRVDENGYSYVPTPHDALPYFYAANARDTRAGIVHEGAHYQQLAMSWRHQRPLRRHYYDSGVNEGIAFYNEELLLAAGLFDNAPHSQTVMYNFMKLRAMRVIVDVELATGGIDIPTATTYLEKKVPMDHETAYEEAVFFSSNPGQALTYQIGKTQIIKLFSDAIAKKRGDSQPFSMQEFHDYLWINGNVPLSLLRFEYLNDSSELELIQNTKKRKGE